MHVCCLNFNKVSVSVFIIFLLRSVLNFHLWKKLLKIAKIDKNRTKAIDV